MEFPDDEVMIVLAGLAMGTVNDGESRTMLHLEDEKRSCDVEVRPRVLGALENREWIEIDDKVAVKVTEKGTYAIDRWLHKTKGIRVRRR